MNGKSNIYFFTLSNLLGILWMKACCMNVFVMILGTDCQMTLILVLVSVFVFMDVVYVLIFQYFLTIFDHFLAV